MKKFTFFSILFTFLAFLVQAQTTGDYRSKQTGNWNNATSWQYYNGSSWVNASSFPTSADGLITILSPHTITVTAGVTIDQVSVQSGAVLIHNNGTLSLANGTGNDLNVYGTMELNAQFTIGSNALLVVYGIVNKFSGGLTINSGGIISIENNGWFKKVGGTQDVGVGGWIVKGGGTYEHADNGNGIPKADWQPNSICIVSGTINSTPTNLDQNFYNLTWNCPGQTIRRNLSSALTTVLGNLTIASTGSASILLSSSSNQSLNVSGNFYLSGGVFSVTEGGAWVTNIVGDYVQTGGSFLMTDNSASTASGTPTLHISGSFSITNGTFDASQYTGSNSSLGNSIINLDGNMTIGSGGLLTATSSTIGKGTVNFSGSTIQTFSKSGIISNAIDFNVAAGASLDINNEIITGNGTFSLLANATLYIGSPQGIATTGNTGNIQVTGTRSYNTAASYIYNGTAAQTTGTGLPTTIKNITIDNSANITQTANITVTDNLDLNNGSLITNGNTITLGTSASSIGTLTRNNGGIDGTFKRWISTGNTTYLFPLVINGNDKQINMLFTSAPSNGGTLSFQFVASAPGNNGFPLTDGSVHLDSSIGNGYWSLVPANGFSGGTFNLDISAGGVPSIIDPSAVRIITRSNASSSWYFSGTNVYGTTSNGIPIAHRTGLTAAQQFGISGTRWNVLPIHLISFQGSIKNKNVLLEWLSDMEFNNDYYTIERSADGINFFPITIIKSIGNTNTANWYNYTDHNPLSPVNYYRLKQTDLDGKSILFKTIKIKVTDSTPEFYVEKVWASASTKVINLVLYSKVNAVIRVNIFSSNGEVVSNTSNPCLSGVNRLQILPGKPLSPGVYNMLIESNGQVVSNRVVFK